MDLLAYLLPFSLLSHTINRFIPSSSHDAITIEKLDRILDQARMSEDRALALQAFGKAIEVKVDVRALLLLYSHYSNMLTLPERARIRMRLIEMAGIKLERMSMSQRYKLETLLQELERIGEVTRTDRTVRAIVRMGCIS
jgi:hypothetical protein